MKKEPRIRAIERLLLQFHAIFDWAERRGLRLSPAAYAAVKRELDCVYPMINRCRSPALRDALLSLYAPASARLNAHDPARSPC